MDASIIDRHVLDTLKESVEVLNSVSLLSDPSKVKEDINRDVDIVENNLLEHLWNIYSKKFVKTKCYRYLESIREDNNRVNTNMAELGMMLITS